MERNKTPLTGKYILRNNEFTNQVSKGHEKGIMLSNKYYLDIQTLLRTPLSKTEARRYGQLHKMTLPTKKQMLLLQQNADIVNISLMRIGLTDCFVTDNVVQDFWGLYEKPQNIQQRKRVAFIVAVE